MEEISYCGLRCDECPIFIATKTDDDNLREKLAKDYSTESCTFTKEDMNCYGCHSDKIKDSKMCGNCVIRSCPQNAAISNCGECPSFPCKHIKKYVPKRTDNRKTLEKIHCEKAR